MLTEKDFTAKHAELYQLMGDLSEDCHAAGWVTGNEYAIWAALQDGGRRYGAGEMDPEKLERCRTLSQELGGWIAWFDDDVDRTMPSEEWGPRFVPMKQWLLMV
jgi:hypothetical protein